MKAKWGQNFLIDEKWQHRVVDLFKPEGAFAEIGPGQGAITQHLAQRYKGFKVFEIDPRWAEWHRTQTGYTVIEGDFLDWRFELTPEEEKSFSLIGNLPYESGSQMLIQICENSEKVKSFLFLLQKEVVERISAKPKTKDMSSFSVLVQGQYNIEALDVIPPRAFKPAPLVTSQLVRGTLRGDRHQKSKEYLKFVRHSFLNKRKTLKNNWKSLISLEAIDQILAEFSFSHTVRPEEIDVEKWPLLYDRVRSARSG